MNSIGMIRMLMKRITSESFYSHFFTFYQCLSFRQSISFLKMLSLNDSFGFFSFFSHICFAFHHRRIADTETYKLTGLYPDTVYYIWLAARSQRGEGATTPPIPVRTKQYGKHALFPFLSNYCFVFSLNISIININIIIRLSLRHM